MYMNINMNNHDQSMWIYENCLIAESHAIQSKNTVRTNIKHYKDTSIKHPISGQSTPMVKGCMEYV